jgi:apolipoprotein N-acyltransferase
VHLVPYGEYVPYEDLLRYLGVTDAIAMPGGFSAAPARSLLTLPGGRSFYPLICYEAIFPEEFSSSLDRATALLNVTNDGWFGATPGPYQHFQQARLRAVETGLPLIRAANTGISAFVDPFGRISKGLDYNKKGVIDSTIGGSAVPHWNNSARQNYFWLVLAAMVAIAAGSRAGFKFGTN